MRSNGMLVAGLLLALSACGTAVPTGTSRYQTITLQAEAAAAQATQATLGRGQSELTTLLLVDRPDLLDGLNLSSAQYSQVYHLADLDAQPAPSSADLTSVRDSREAYRTALTNAFLAEEFSPVAAVAARPAESNRSQALADQIVALYQLLSPTQRTQVVRNLTSPDPAAQSTLSGAFSENLLDQYSLAMNLDGSQKNQLEAILIDEASQRRQQQQNQRQQLMNVLQSALAHSEPTAADLLSQLSGSNRANPAQWDETLKQIHDLLDADQREVWVELNGWNNPLPSLSSVRSNG